MIRQLTTAVIADRDVGTVFYDDLAVCESHTHTFFEIAYVIAGEAIHTIDGKSAPVKAGNYVIIEPGSSHSFVKTPVCEKLTVINCIFTANYIYRKAKDNTFMALLENPLLNVDASQIIASPVHYVYEDDNDYVLHMLSAIQYEYTHKMTNYMLIIKQLLNSVIIASVRKVSAETMQVINSTTFIKDYTSIHYAEDGILNRISQLLHYSTQHLSARFKTDTGETFKHFLQRTRCNAAVQLMTYTNMTIAEISVAVGYRDVKYFTEIFKKYENVTPKKLKMHFSSIYKHKAEKTENERNEQKEK